MMAKKCIATFLRVSLAAVAFVAIARSVAFAKPLQPSQIKFRRLPPKQFSAPLGSSITLECEAGGSPPPTLHWLKDGKRILQNIAEDDNQIADIQESAAESRIGLSASRSRLFIDCADETDVATYTCVAENSYSRISTHTKFSITKQSLKQQQQQQQQRPALIENEVSSADIGDNINDEADYVPKCLTTAKGIPEPVRINMWTHNMVELMRNNVVIFCRSNRVTCDQQSQQQLNQLQSTINLKPATVTWTLPNDKQVDSLNMDKFEILSTGDLLIKDLNWSDMGSYVCTVSDKDSSDSISTFVYPTRVKVDKPSAATATLNSKTGDNR